MTGFLNELMRRRVLRAAAGYLIFAWIAAQVAAVVFPPLGLGAGAQRIVLAGLTAGFPVIVILAWLFVLTPEGLRREAAPDTPRSGAARLVDPLIALVVFSVSVFFMWDILVRAPERVDIAAPGESRATPAERASIAVLPFVNMSADSQIEYFGDGLTEEIIHALVKVDGLKVAGRTSAFYFKDRQIDLRDIGQQLGVAMVLEGSVRAEGQNLKVTAQLIDTLDGFHIWSETYEAGADNLLQVQEKIAQQVIRRVRELGAPDMATQGGAGAKAAGAGLTDISFKDPALYSDYLLALSKYRGGDLSELIEAETGLTRIVKLDPDNAAAHALLARVMAQKWTEGGFDEVTTYDTAERIARQAVELAPHAAEAHLALAETHLIRRGIGDPQAESRYEAALQTAYEFGPDNVDVLLEMLGNQAFGAAEETVVFEKLLRLDPLNPNVLLAEAQRLIMAGEWDAARRKLAAGMDIHPSASDFPEELGRMEEHLGHLAAAAQAMEKAAELGGGWHRQLWASYCASMGDMACARRALDVAGDDKLQARLAMLDGDLERARELFSFTFHASIVAGKQGDWSGAADYLRRDFPQWFDLTEPADPAGLEDGYLWTARVLLGIGETERAHMHAHSLVNRYEGGRNMDDKAHVHRNILAGAYAILGENERAMEELEKSVEAGFRNVWKTLRWQNLEWPPDQHPVFEGLWGEPRFERLMTNIAAQNAEQLTLWQQAAAAED